MREVEDHVVFEHTEVFIVLGVLVEGGEEGIPGEDHEFDEGLRGVGNQGDLASHKGGDVEELASPERPLELHLTTVVQVRTNLTNHNQIIPTFTSPSSM